MTDTDERDGFAHLYYGPGKGKTTAAAGLAARAAGHGQTVSLLQFMKGHEQMREQYGEVLMYRDLPAIDVEQFPAGHAQTAEDLSEDERATLREGLDTASRVVSEGAVDLVVLDELTVLWELGLVDGDDLVALTEDRAGPVELVLTGRTAPPAVIDAVDYVTYMGEMKYPFHRDVGPRQGVEY